jgi:hypothetical protein
MTKTIININKNIIGRNNKTGERNPPIRVSKGKYGKPEYYSEYIIGNIKIKYDHENPLPCGAKVWIEEL